MGKIIKYKGSRESKKRVLYPNGKYASKSAVKLIKQNADHKKDPIDDVCSGVRK